MTNPTNSENLCKCLPYGKDSWEDLKCKVPDVDDFVNENPEFPYCSNYDPVKAMAIIEAICELFHEAFKCRDARFKEEVQDLLKTCSNFLDVWNAMCARKIIQTRRSLRREYIRLLRLPLSDHLYTKEYAEGCAGDAMDKDEKAAELEKKRKAEQEEGAAQKKAKLD